ncbi:hypothetical protein N7540_005194 [Penicillium herquei]|nr:hypothetical protein N7540_005194 [Penicillium herquei]
MQLVGRIATAPCNACLALNGPFATCVKVEGYPGITCCANCHWWEQDDLCQVDVSSSINPRPPPPPGSSGTYRSSRQSSTQSTLHISQPLSRQSSDDNHHRRRDSHNSRDYGQHGRHSEQDRYGLVHPHRPTFSQETHTSHHNPQGSRVPQHTPRRPHVPRTTQQSDASHERRSQSPVQTNNQRFEMLRELYGRMDELDAALVRQLSAWTATRQAWARFAVVWSQFLDIGYQTKQDD